ncbi:MAG: zf-HC2 domain-containing protein [Deltaproteobacteria bacterium]|nr:zf-HC2 domain-containing protein [Deltaproteobacteria bacterium]
MQPDCLEMYRRMSDYLDRECDEVTLAHIERHLKECKACGDCLDSIRKTIELARVLPDEPIPDTVRNSLRRVLQECRKRG